MMDEKKDWNAALLKAAQAEIRRRESLLPLFAELEAEIPETLRDVFSKDEAVAEWLITPAYGLDDRIPLVVARTAGGRKELMALLMRIVHGIY